MFHECFTEQGRRPPFVIVAEIVSRELFHGVILGVCVDSVRFRYARSVPPLLFRRCFAFGLRALLRGFRFKAFKRRFLGRLR